MIQTPTSINQTHCVCRCVALAVSARAGKGAVNRQKINVTVIAARNLVAADIGGTSDPFVQLIVRNRGTLKQTSTMRKTISPIWNEEFEFEVVDPINDVLDVTVFDWDSAGTNDFLGECAVPIPMVANASRPIQQWFPLLDSFAASITHSKTDRGQIHLRLVWTDANGITESGGAAAAPAPATEVPVAVDFASFAIPPDDTQAVAQQTAVQQTAAQNSAMLQQAALQQAIVAQQQQQQQQQQAMARQQAMMAQQQQPSAMMMQPGFMPPMAMMQPGMYAQPQPGMHALPMPMMGRYAGAHPAQPVTMHGHGGKSFKHGKFKGGKSFKKDKHKK